MAIASSAVVLHRVHAKWMSKCTPFGMNGPNALPITLDGLGACRMAGKRTAVMNFYV